MSELEPRYRLAEDSTGWAPTSLEWDLVHRGLNSVEARQRRLDNRVVEIFREFDALRVDNERLASQLAGIEAKLDLLLADRGPDTPTL